MGIFIWILYNVDCLLQQQNFYGGYIIYEQQGAKTTQYKHTVCVGGYSGGNDATWLSIKKDNTYTNDYFPSYPTIFDNKSYSKIKSRAESKDRKTVTAYKYTTLQKNSPATHTVSYGRLKKGSWLLNYRYCSGGGCRSQVTTMEKY